MTLWLRRLTSAERFEVQCWKQLLRPGATVADVGANLGLYTLLAARVVGPQGHVHGFEPDPENASALERSVQANGYRNVTIHRAAVAESCGALRLYRRAEHHGDHRIYRPPTPEGRERADIGVPSVTLDSLFGDAVPLHLVKLDIQGAEGRAIAGMRQTLAANPDLRLVLEFWPEGLRQCGTDPQGLLEELRAMGFALAIVDNRRRRLLEAGNDEIMELCRRERYVILLAQRARR